MPSAGHWVGFEAQIRVLHWTYDAAAESDSEQVRQSEVRSLHTPFVVETGLVGADQAPATIHEFAKLLALRVRKRGNIRQDERLEWVQMGTVEQPIMHHLEGDPRFDECLIPAERVLFDFGAVKPRGMLRID